MSNNIFSMILGHQWHNTYIHTFPQSNCCRQSHDSVCSRTAVLQKVNENIPDSGIVGGGATIADPLADEPCDTPFNDGETDRLADVEVE
jgi:hypothetical protein